MAVVELSTVKVHRNQIKAYRKRGSTKLKLTVEVEALDRPPRIHPGRAQHRPRIPQHRQTTVRASQLFHKLGLSILIRVAQVPKDPSVKGSDGIDILEEWKGVGEVGWMDPGRRESWAGGGAG